MVEVSTASVQLQKRTANLHAMLLLLHVADVNPTVSSSLQQSFCVRAHTYVICIDININ